MRRAELDLCRVFACVSVLIIHTSAEYFWTVPLTSVDFAFINFLASSVRGSVPLFFMLSGVLFLTRENMDIKHSIIPHSIRLIGLYLFWSFIYACGKFSLGQIDRTSSLLSTIVESHYHLWFLPAMALCYLFLPPVYYALHGKQLEFKYFLVLFFIWGILFKAFEISPFPVPNLLRFSQSFPLEHLSYLGYAVWGAWLDTKSMSRKIRWIALASFLFISITATIENQLFSFQQSFADGWLTFDYFSVTSFLQATSIFCFFLSLKDYQWEHAKALASLSDATLGVYLIHPLIIGILKHIGFFSLPVGTITQSTLLLITLTIVCFTFTLLAKQVPIIKRCI